MPGIVIGILTEAITGSGIAHQIGLGALVDRYAHAAPSSCHSVSQIFLKLRTTPWGQHHG